MEEGRRSSGIIRAATGWGCQLKAVHLHLRSLTAQNGGSFYIHLIERQKKNASVRRIIGVIWMLSDVLRTVFRPELATLLTPERKKKILHPEPLTEGRKSNA